MELGIEGLAGLAEALEAELVGEERLELGCGGLEGAGEVPVLAGELDLVDSERRPVMIAGSTLEVRA